MGWLDALFRHPLVVGLVLLALTTVVSVIVKRHRRAKELPPETPRAAPPPAETEKPDLTASKWRWAVAGKVNKYEFDIRINNPSPEQFVLQDFTVEFRMEQSVHTTHSEDNGIVVKRTLENPDQKVPAVTVGPKGFDAIHVWGTIPQKEDAVKLAMLPVTAYFVASLQSGGQCECVLGETGDGVKITRSPLPSVLPFVGNPYTQGQ